MKALSWLAIPMLILAPLFSACGGREPVGRSSGVNCVANGRAYLQVLGSGGPMHAEGRGGSAYAVWLSGRPVVVVDMGGDTPTALARAGALPGSIDTLLISHLHADHVSGIPDFLWGEITAGRRTELTVAGPDGDGADFPDVSTFFQRLIGQSGAFPRMNGLLSGRPFPLRLIPLAAARGSGPQVVLDLAGIKITALPIPHGPAPALAFRLDGPSFSVVLGGDQSGRAPGFAEFAANADVLVLHALLNDLADSHPLTEIVASPERLGTLAQSSGAKQVILSHLMGESGDGEQARIWSLRRTDEVLAGVRRVYQGPVGLATDLQCVELP